MKKLLFAAPLALSLALAGCGETAVEDVTDSKSSASKENSEKKEKKDEDKIYKVGETVKVDGVEITITNAAFTSPAEYSETQNGKVLTLDVKVVNTNENSSYIDETDFNLYDLEDNQFESYFGYDKMAISADLNSGKQKKGNLYYDVSEEKAYELVYAPAFSWDNKEVKWKIKVQ